MPSTLSLLRSVKLHPWERAPAHFGLPHCSLSRGSPLHARLPRGTRSKTAGVPRTVKHSPHLVRSEQQPEGSRDNARSVKDSTPRAQSPQVQLRDGSMIPAVAFGTGTSWGFGRNNADEGLPDMLVSVLEAGYRHIDTAEVYATEALVGQALARFFAGGGTRDDVFLSSKIWQTNHRAERVEAACRASLQQLGVSSLDLYLVHYPVGWTPESQAPDRITVDPEADLVSTWRAMEGLKDAGLVKHIGVSNFSIDHLEEIMARCQIAPEVNQIEFHPCMHDLALQEYCRARGIGIIGYGPTIPVNVPCPGDVPSIAARLATKYGKTAGQVLLRWSFQQGNVVLTTTTKRERLPENLDWMDFALTEAEVAELGAAGRAQPFRKFGNEWKVKSGDLLFPPGPGLGFAPAKA